MGARSGGGAGSGVGSRGGVIRKGTDISKLAGQTLTLHKGSKNHGAVTLQINKAGNGQYGMVLNTPNGHTTITTRPKAQAQEVLNNFMGLNNWIKATNGGTKV